MSELDRIVAFLKDMDKKLTKKASLYVIGGAAVTLAYSPENRTSDIDVVEADAELEQTGGPASELAKFHGVHISKVFDISFSVPDGWRQRCVSLELGLRKLAVFVADPYDIVLGKLARFEPKDIDDMLSLVKGGFIVPDVFINKINENLAEIKQSHAYRQNAMLAFEILFDGKVVFKRGKAYFQNK